MTTSSNNTDSSQDKNQETPSSSGYSDEQPKKEEESKEEVENYGYEMDDEEEKSAASEDKDDDKQEKSSEDEDSEEKKVEKPATGYDDEEEEPEPKKEEKKEEDKDKKDDEETSEEEFKKQAEEALKELPEGYSKEKTLEFAIKHKLTVDQIKAYSEMTKVEQEEAVKQFEEEKIATRKAWKSELKDDPDFGGENFVKNVDRVEKLLETYMVNTKKVLTERGSMLPPYIMRDLLSIAKTLNPTTKLEGGDPPTPPKKDDGNFLEDMYQ